MRVLLTITLCLTCAAHARSEADPSDVYHRKLAGIEAEYRQAIAKQVLHADRVIVHIVSFDDLSDEDFFGDPKDQISVSPYGKVTKSIKEKELSGKERNELLPALAEQIAKPGHMGGALCHFPVHAVRVYHGERLIYEGTFCWVCENFGFTYPSGAAWLDTSEEMEAVFNQLLPIPDTELERFRKKYKKEK